MTKQITITLPWPNPILNPNKRVHWSKRVGPIASARHVGSVLTREATGRLRVKRVITMSVTFHPPNKSRRDDDNLIASFKPSRDGIADALRVDDATFHPAYHFGEVERPLGKVVVAMTVEAL